MLSFLSDYTEGAHPKVLEHLIKRNMVTLCGYGLDEDTAAAKAKICALCGRDDLQIQFLTGGTQTNQIAIDCLLRSYEGVVAAATGHVNGHEAGAIEHSGHKVLALPPEDGKVTARALRRYMEGFCADDSREHAVQPGMVYISHPTELGTLYSRDELTALSACCREHSLKLYMDGARLGYGLASAESDVALGDICELCDAFYIGGTKVGALCGEALVFTKGNIPEHFMAYIKQRGALLAKTRVVSQQFDALFTDGLYCEIGRHGTELALKLKRALMEKGYELFIDSPTNQQFAVLDRARAEELSRGVAFTPWQELEGDRLAVRFVTSWATREEDVDALIALL